MADVTARLRVELKAFGIQSIKSAGGALGALQASAKAASALERQRQRETRAGERAAEKANRGAITFEGEMAKLQRQRQRSDFRRQAKDQLDGGRSGSASFFTGHGFASRARQVVGGIRDLTVAAYGMQMAFGAVGGAVSAVMDPLREFQTNMARAQAKGLSKETAASVAMLAKEMGRSSQYSATQVSAASVELAAAGLTSEKDQRAALPSVLRFSQAGELNTERAASLLVETGGQFGLGADQFERMGDSIVKAANISTISVEDLAESLKVAGPEARAAGLDLEKTATAIALLGEKGGIKGSAAGTGFAGIISRMARPRKQGLKALSQLGLSEKDTQAGLQDMPTFFRKLNDAMNKKGLNDAQRLSFAGLIFGAEHAKTGLTLLRAAVDDGGSAWKNYDQQMASSQGTLRTTAAIMGDTLEGKIQKMNASIETAEITLGEQFLPMLTAAIPKIADAANATGKWVGENGELLVTLTKVGGALASGFAVYKAGSALAGITASLLGPAATAAITAAGTTLGGTLAAAIAAGVVGYGLTTALLDLTKGETGTNAMEDFGRWAFDAQYGTEAARQSGRGMNETPRGGPGSETQTERESVTAEQTQFNAVTGQIEITVKDNRVEVKTKARGQVALRTGANPGAPAADVPLFLGL